MKVDNLFDFMEANWKKNLFVRLSSSNTSQVEWIKITHATISHSCTGTKLNGWITLENKHLITLNNIETMTILI